MKQELSPLEDRGVILANVNAPDGSTLEYTNRYAEAGAHRPAVQGIRPHLCQRGQPHGGPGQRGLPHGRLG
jgi:multidrug efflux pump subunit AcrB